MKVISKEDVIHQTHAHPPQGGTLHSIMANNKNIYDKITIVITI